MFSVPGVSNTTGVRFATLMRLLCRQNGGTFVGLSRLKKVGILLKPFPDLARRHSTGGLHSSASSTY